MLINKLYSVGGQLATISNSALSYNFDPYDPSTLPINVVRVRTNDSSVPYKTTNTTYETAMLVPGTTDIYDVYKSGDSFDELLHDSYNVIEILGANSTNITSMNRMCAFCHLVKVSYFDTSNVTNMASMFVECSIKDIPLFDTSNVTSMNAMFCDCGSLESVPLFNTSSVTSMAAMFGGCDSLTSVPLFDTSNVTDMHSMFSECYALESVPTFDTHNVTSMANMFSRISNNNALTAVPLFNLDSVVDMDYMFDNCSNVRTGAYALYQEAISQTNNISHSGTFFRCGNLNTSGRAELNLIPADWQ